MPHKQSFYIGGHWLPPATLLRKDVIDPSTEMKIDEIALGAGEDVDRAVVAARRAFQSFGRSSVAERLDILSRVIEVYKCRGPELADLLSREMGAPLSLAHNQHVPMGLAHLEQAARTLSEYVFEERLGQSVVVKEPIGVVGMITPWNWPLNQIACKIGPALAAGCTMVLKPSELAPLSAIVFAEILDQAAVPPGVFNLVNGEGATVGQAIAAHPDVDMISFTGSTGAGIQVAKTAADTVKRVHQELGGKSANLLLPDVDMEHVVPKGVAACFGNSGQSCNAPTRMLVPRDKQDEAARIANRVAEQYVVGPARNDGVTMGPVVSRQQAEKISAYIEAGVAEGARLVTGGPGRPSHLSRGHFVRPTIFADVSNTMRIAREEIFGPVLSIMPYDSVEEAIELANDSCFGLATYIQAKDLAAARQAASRVRTGSVYINHPSWNPALPVGGYRQSGNGRERGKFGMDDFMEIKSIAGFHEA